MINLVMYGGAGVCVCVHMCVCVCVHACIYTHNYVLCMHVVDLK